MSFSFLPPIDHHLLNRPFAFAIGGV